MAKNKIQTIDLTEEQLATKTERPETEEKSSETKIKKSASKKKASKKADPKDQDESKKETKDDSAKESEVAKPKQRGKKYVEARSRVDRTRTYPLMEAISLVKSTSYSGFDGTISAHLNLTKEINPVEVSFPHSTGKNIRVAIVDEEILDQIAKEEIAFDVLLAKPAMMPKLTRYARFLGPRGLMPNPKNGTVTSDPETKKASLLAGAVVVRAEKKAPLLHVRIGKVSQPENELQANLEALIKAINPVNIAKITLAATMGPGVKVQL